MKKIAVCGGAGFIGFHLCRRLRNDGHYVVSFDRKLPEFTTLEDSPAHEYHTFDLLNDPSYYAAYRFEEFDEVYQLAAEMGGAGYVFTGEHDGEIMHNSARINLNVLEACRKAKVPKIFFASSACVYESFDPLPIVTHDTREQLGYFGMTACAEHDAGRPDSPYGLEKLFAEQLYTSYAHQYDMQVRIGRFHNIFGPYGTWQGGREKAPAAFCRKIAEGAGTIECWGDGKQTRSFLYVDEAIEATVRLMASNFSKPLNIGSSEMVAIDDLIRMIAEIARRYPAWKHVPGPTGVRGRNSDNTLIEQVLGWKPTGKLVDGLAPTYQWVAERVKKRDQRLAEIGQTR